MTSTRRPYGQDEFGFDTEQVHAGESIGDGFGARVTPIHMSNGFVFDSFDHSEARFRGDDGGWVYSRNANPTNSVAEARLTALEHGAETILVGSGQAAVTVALLGILKAGDHLLASKSLFEGSKGLFRENFGRFGIDVDFVDDAHDLSEWRGLLRPTTRAVFAESIPNPKNDLIDFDLIAGFAEDAGIPFVVDSTSATPFLVRPIDHGAHIVVHSASKFLTGHGASIAGAIVDGGTFDWSRYPQKFPQFADRSYADFTRSVIAARLGPVLSPFNAFLLLQGLETLSLRMERHSRNALTIARWLEGRPEVESVDYAGLEANRYHPIAERYYPNGTGSVFGFTLAGGRAAARTVIDAVELFSRMTNIGDVRSMILHPATTSHSQVDPRDRARNGIADGLIRLSVGIEDAADLIADLDRAFARLALPVAEPAVALP
ncbi:MAG: PLP-dependent transferase [Actinomycetota bacterium]